MAAHDDDRTAKRSMAEHAHDDAESFTSVGPDGLASACRLGRGDRREGRAGETERGRDVACAQRFHPRHSLRRHFQHRAFAGAMDCENKSSMDQLSRIAGDLTDETRLNVSIDWARAPKGENISGAIEIDGAGASRTVKVPIFNPTKPRLEGLKGFVESNGVVSIEAEHFTRKIDRAGSSWQVIPGLGRTGDSAAVFPTTGTSFNPVSAPVLEYDFYAFTTGKVNAVANLVPTHPILAGRGLRYAIGFDDQAPQVVTVGADLQIPSRPWSLNVINSSTVGASTHEIKTAGRHVLKIYAVDPGAVLDKIVLDLGGLHPSYLGPVETRVRGFMKQPR